MRKLFRKMMKIIPSQKKNKALLNLLLTAFCWGGGELTLTFPAQSETVFEKVRNTSFLNIAIREDSPPLGYRDQENNLRGICLDFANFIRQELRKELNQQVIGIKLVRSTLFNRYELVKEGSVYLECGPNTIQNNPEIAYSVPFLITGTQFLIRASDENRFNVNEKLENVTIGVLRNTTTQRLIVNRYPNANIQEFQGINGRLRGIQALEAGIIDGFASDAILLIGEATLQGLRIQDYSIVPKQPLDCVSYGLILPANDPQWQEFINNTLKKPETKQILKKWLELLGPYLQRTEEFCRSQSSP